MNSMIEGTLSGIVASAIYEIGKNILIQLKHDDKKQVLEKKDVQEYVSKKLGTKYAELFMSGIFDEFMKSPLIEDTIYNYTLYIVSGKAVEVSNITNLNSNKNIEEKELIKFFSKELFEKYEKSEAINIPNYKLIHSFFKDFFKVCSEYVFSILSQEDMIMSFLLNYRIGICENKFLDKMDSLVDDLTKSTNIKMASPQIEFINIKDRYIKLIKENNKFAHIYLLDKFLMEDFYVPPFFISGKDVDLLTDTSYRIIYRTEEKHAYLDKAINYSSGWKYIFGKGNIIYITGGAGYGKSLFLKMLICNFEQLNIIDSSNYIVIYGDLKNFYLNNSDNPISVEEFLKNSMKKETLMDENEISNDFINYFLSQGRCIILLDALDEVERNRREKIHSMIVNYFKMKNPNNKVCITSRSRGFVPEENIEVLMIEPLQPNQIIEYVDNIIRLGKFDENDKETFLNQAQVLIRKRFLSSFLILSLMINIYKAERELPENKLELYQKCFEYIANRREKEKSGIKYNWSLISTLMKDNTFMELSNLCLPNNSDVHKDVVKAKLLEIYKNKYVSECETEQAIDDFLAFCSDRTELFVPASGEDNYKFFHRSFFEYFYSQFLFTRAQNAEEIYTLWKNFDVDSEVFELSLAMFKQKNEVKYQEIVVYLLDRINSKDLDDKEKLTTLNIFVLCLQIIDDATYKKQFTEFLLSNLDFCVRYIKEIQNQRFISEVVLSDKQLSQLMAEKYREVSIYEIISLLTRVCDMNKEADTEENQNRFLEVAGNIFTRYILDEFYLSIFFNVFSFDKVIKDLSIEDVKLICKKYAPKNKKIIKKYLAIPHNLIINIKINFDTKHFWIPVEI